MEWRVVRYDIGKRVQSALFNTVAGLSVGPQESFHLVLTAKVPDAIFTENQHAERVFNLTAVSKLHMSGLSGKRSMWFREPHGVDLIVDEHIQAQFDIVDLNTKHVC